MGPDLQSVALTCLVCIWMGQVLVSAALGVHVYCKAFHLCRLGLQVALHFGFDSRAHRLTDGV
jgi:hypothetical protein